MQVRNYYDIAGSVKQILKDLDVESLNLLLLPADGSMETIRVSLPSSFPASSPAWLANADIKSWLQACLLLSNHMLRIARCFCAYQSLCCNVKLVTSTIRWYCHQW